MTSWHYRFILGQSGLKINNLLPYEDFLMFLITNPWAAGSECGWESVCIPGEKSFFSSHFCGGFGWSRSGSEVFRASYYWRSARVGTNLSMNAPAARTSVSPRVKMHSPRSWTPHCAHPVGVIIFLWFSAFAQCNSLRGKDQQNKIKFPLHLTNQGKTRAPSKVEKHDFISYHCFDLILEKSVLCIEAWFLPESDEQKRNTSIIESLQELDKTVCKTPGTGNLLNKP